MLVVLDDVKIGIYSKTLLYDRDTDEYFIHTFAIATSGGPGSVETWAGEKTSRENEIIFSMFNRKDLE